MGIDYFAFYSHQFYIMFLSQALMDLPGQPSLDLDRRALAIAKDAYEKHFVNTSDEAMMRQKELDSFRPEEQTVYYSSLTNLQSFQSLSPYMGMEVTEELSEATRVVVGASQFAIPRQELKEQFDKAKAENPDLLWESESHFAGLLYFWMERKGVSLFWS